MASESGVELLIFFYLSSERQAIKYFERSPMEDILLINSAFVFCHLFFVFLFFVCLLMKQETDTAKPKVRIRNSLC